ncbi:hypothetical protein AB0A95_33870 [Micromonospora sp. NPDC049230]|uniref:hypothetical protein n=1 Tax=Micromonospora sp. NPDC049230 TaxID=3155502 RepID=UPI0034021ECB
MTTEQPHLDEDGVPIGAPVVPGRITIALDARGLYGPEVDLQVGTYEGNPDGDVDAWELGEAVPQRWQVRLIAELAQVTVASLHWPLEPGETEGRMWVCGRSGPNGGGRRVCHQVPMAIVPPAAEDPARSRQGALPIRYGA